MWPELTADDIVAGIRLIRDNFRGALLLLEGGRDCKLFDRHIDKDNCRTIPTYGRELLTATLQRCEELNLDGVVGVFDADFDHVLGVAHLPPNGIRLHVHDLEMMLLESDAFETVCDELVSAGKVQAFLAAVHCPDLRTALYGVARFVGRLRLLNVRDGLNLKLDGLNLGEYANSHTLELNRERLVQSVLRATANPALSVPNIIHRAANIDIGGIQDAQLLCGHDVVELLARGLRRAIGSKNSRIADPEHLEALLRMAYDAADFEQTPVRNQLEQWQAMHQPYRLFP